MKYFLLLAVAFCFSAFAADPPTDPVPDTPIKAEFVDQILAGDGGETCVPGDEICCDLGNGDGRYCKPPPEIWNEDNVVTILTANGLRRGTITFRPG